MRGRTGRPSVAEDSARFLLMLKRPAARGGTRMSCPSSRIARLSVRSTACCRRPARTLLGVPVIRRRGSTHHNRVEINWVENNSRGDPKCNQHKCDGLRHLHICSGRCSGDHLQVEETKTHFQTVRPTKLPPATKTTHHQEWWRRSRRGQQHRRHRGRRATRCDSGLVASAAFQAMAVLECALQLAFVSSGVVLSTLGFWMGK